MSLGSGFGVKAWSSFTTRKVEYLDAEFTEGNQYRVMHLRTERSRKLREFYYANTDKPQLCDMCLMDTILQYPWADRLIELHHLLPLSSPVRVEAKATSIGDVVGLCPTCHRATHKFYSKWLNDNCRKDFQDQNEARQVYAEAKQTIVLA